MFMLALYLNGPVSVLNNYSSSTSAAFIQTTGSWKRLSVKIVHAMPDL